ncbi:hypothetical protein EDC30_11339 [Paucimonas lemoignei]|uniref:Toxin CptA n=1 Tax=Paucimonas lemoignei TaxID=29443 RepID=A0A4R3HQJ1_PAULE|nr:protein YgfX [Paucimonas lemoignei]TCS34343.1 hypothetical protein EDC30_11339 [Paucimonas lemoignei]
MSIAVSTVVMPSRRLAIVQGSFCLGLVAVAAYLVISPTIHLSLAWRVALALILAVISVWASHALIWRGKSLRIDISEHGQITVTEDKTCTVHRGQAGTDKPPQQDQNGTAVVTLRHDSTIWPHLLLLRLQAEDRRIRNILILRDSVSAEEFRSLSVACRWIAAHNGQAKR